MQNSQIHPTVSTKVKEKVQPKEAPKYHVILWNDESHTFDYVIVMMHDLFGYSVEQGFQIAKTVDSQGKAIVLTSGLEEAEFKRDQIHAYGADPQLNDCVGAMFATLERAR